MPVYFTKRAFLSDGWAMDVQITVDEQGIIQRICSGSSDEGCQILSGPIVPDAKSSLTCLSAYDVRTRRNCR